MATALTRGEEGLVVVTPHSQSHTEHARWWLAGEEYCVVCCQFYAYELRIHCTHCDRALCSDCIVEVSETRQLLCEECHAAAREV